jgi:hypothetical protein
VDFVLGSVAHGCESAGSDIDVMLIGDFSLGQAVDVLHPTQAVLGHGVGGVQAKVIVLDALRKRRNLSDYPGDLIPDADATAECLASAQELLAHVRASLQARRPDGL